jgi:hypothetical protein
MKVRSWSLVLALALGLLAVTALPAAAQAPTPSLARPAAAGDTPTVGGTAPLYAAAGGVVQLSSGCTADLDCPDGTHISCTGQQSCLVGSTYVECDGDKWPYCPGTCAVGPHCVKAFQCYDFCGGVGICSAGGCCIC